MNDIKFGAEQVENSNHMIPTPVKKKTNSKCLYFKNDKCRMTVKCRYYQKNIEDSDYCPVDGYSNLCLRLI